ncbi:TPA: 4-hydroxy-3-methylbut-2-enyl diphosphate reductase, partial [Candidatus Poribacteria bacterium]|nr:4-hydroxy-3-methylbut-2-enyl diphosphate reductase [Candidatus Poribacteria bacterium]HEX29333.1 4-hydroxy-3-methylbut-2-enyl diphosphate reductase [Candidatus Poribacteria bacterium]
HIETADEIDPKWFEGAELVGIAAGASTPDFIIQGVVERLRGLSVRD